MVKERRLMSYDLLQSGDCQLALVKSHAYRPNFVSHLTNAANALNVELTWLSNNYIAAIRGAYGTTLIVGYHFPLNSAAASAMANDKVATAEILACSEVPHIRHTLIRFKSTRRLAREVQRVTDLFPFPVVVKPHRGNGGRDVIRADSEDALVAALIDLRARHQALAVSPWLDIQHEYRVIALDNHVQLIFEKVKATPEDIERRISCSKTEWRHNLKHGSVPVIQTARDVCNPLSTLALRAIDTLGLRFASIDIAATGDNFAVLEINSGVCLERFGSFSAEHFNHAGLIYSRALGACIVRADG
jgi:glutathione synthase/RimK-type ligase-like ATP-grasp enzyme